MRRLNGGFTLIEVIGAVAAFVIAFLAGSAAFARLLQQQSTSYHRTLAASATMLLVDRYADHATPGSDFVTKNGDMIEAVTAVPDLHFQGDDYKSGDKIYVFKSSTSDFSAPELQSYRPLILTISNTSATESDSAMQPMQWRQLSVWQGQPDLVKAGGPATMHFLARFLIPYQY